MRCAWLVLGAGLPLTAAAVPPDFSKGGILFTVNVGYGVWGIDLDRLAEQIGAIDDPGIFKDDARNGLALALGLGYNILGHATIEANLTATGWEVFNANRGGGGFLAGIARWHPMEIFMRGRERPVDGSIFFGAGYGLAGQRRGMDGLVFELGLAGDYYFTPGFYASLYFRWIFLNFANWYINFDARHLPGNTLPLPKGSGGTFFTAGLAVGFRFVP